MEPYDPPGQLLQAEEPAVLYLPAPQVVHVEEDVAPIAALYFPATQDVQLLAPDPEYFPAPHVEHELEPLEENVPAPQLRHDVPPEEYVPAAQVEQEVAPVEGAIDPPEQDAHEPEPLLLE